MNVAMNRILLFRKRSIVSQSVRDDLRKLQSARYQSEMLVHGLSGGRPDGVGVLPNLNAR